MSADLLAEFDSFYQKPPSQPNQQPQSQPPQAQSHASQTPHSVTSSSNPFNFSPFGATQRGQSTHSPQPWGSTTQTATTGSHGWGDFSAFSGQTTTSPPAQAGGDDDDGWGDFETAATEPPKAALTVPTQHGGSQRPFKGHRMRASSLDLMSNNLVDLAAYAQSEEVRAGFAAPTAANPPTRNQTPPKKAKESDPNVLFDAEDFDGAEIDDDDDFGDFETGNDGFEDTWPQPMQQSQQPPALPAQSSQLSQQSAKPQSRAPMPLSLDLLSLDDSFSAPANPAVRHGSTLSVTSPTSPYPQAPKSPSFMDRNPFPGLALKTPTSPNFPIPEKTEKDHSPTPVTAWPTFDDGTANPGKDDWSPFEDFPPASDHIEPVKATKPTKTTKPVAPKKAPQKPAPKPVETDDSWDWDAVDSPQPAPSKSTAPKSTAPVVSSSILDNKGSDSAPPPTNIPPPSVLLSIFPQLLDLANTSLFKPLAGQSQSLKDRVTSDPETITFLRAYLLLATVAARVIAGRKLRWHRDKFLSQGMAISAAGAKGMKLAGVDRTQAAREDREAADIAGVWREHVGRLRSAVAAANAAAGRSGQPQLRVPEVAENLPVTTAKVVPTAPKACVVCGLKRDERVTKVDFEVEDSFGEWWIEHWGHRACRNFWAEHEKQLRSR